MTRDTSIASPVLVARAMIARGAPREAEIVLRGAVARDMSATDCRSELIRWTRGLPPAPSDAELSLEVVDGWIRNGMLVEALALLGGIDLGGPAHEWAELLGELLAPVPAHAPPALMQMHRALMTGGASVAMAILEDWPPAAPLPAWASRRLELLRWMLLDNAQIAGDDTPDGEAPSLLASALRSGLARRSLDAMLEAAREHGGGAPDSDTRQVIEALERLSEEARSLGTDESSSSHTVPLHGRASASMQLCMANLAGAQSVYRKLSQSKPSDVELAALFAAVRGLVRVLEGRAFIDRSQPRPVRMTAAFEDTTSPFEKQRALALSPMAYGARATVEGQRRDFDYDDETRQVDLKEIEAIPGFDDITSPRRAERGAASELEDEPTREVSIEDLPKDPLVDGPPDSLDDEPTRDVVSSEPSSKEHPELGRDAALVRSEAKRKLKKRAAQETKPAGSARPGSEQLGAAAIPSEIPPGAGVKSFPKPSDGTAPMGSSRAEVRAAIDAVRPQASTESQPSETSAAKPNPQTEGTSDASPSDASKSDASKSDASPSDASPSDASPSDASKSDASQKKADPSRSDSNGTTAQEAKAEDEDEEWSVVTSPSIRAPAARPETAPLGIPRAPRVPQVGTDVLPASSEYAAEVTAPTAFRPVHLESEHDLVTPEPVSDDAPTSPVSTAPLVERRDSVIVATIVPVGQK